MNCCGNNPSITVRGIPGGRHMRSDRRCRVYCRLPELFWPPTADRAHPRGPPAGRWTKAPPEPMDRVRCRRRRSRCSLLPSFRAACCRPARRRSDRACHPAAVESLFWPASSQPTSGPATCLLRRKPQRREQQRKIPAAMTARITVPPQPECCLRRLCQPEVRRTASCRWPG